MIHQGEEAVGTHLPLSLRNLPRAHARQTFLSGAEKRRARLRGRHVDCEGGWLLLSDGGRCACVRTGEPSQR